MPPTKVGPVIHNGVNPNNPGTAVVVPSNGAAPLMPFGPSLSQAATIPAIPQQLSAEPLLAVSLFDSTDGNALRQGSIGDCYLVTLLECARVNPNFKALINTEPQEVIQKVDGKDMVYKGYSYTFKSQTTGRERNIVVAVDDVKRWNEKVDGLKGPEWAQAIEYAYGIFRQMEAGKELDEADLVADLNGGFASEVYSAITNGKGNGLYFTMDWAGKKGIEQTLARFNPKTDLMCLGSKFKGSLTRSDLIHQHAYVVKDVIEHEWKNGWFVLDKVIVLDPHDTTKTIELSRDDVYQNFNAVDFMGGIVK